MTELIVLSVSGPAIAETQAEQKNQHKGANPERGIGGHSFPLSETGPATARLRERSPSGVRQHPVAAAGRRGSTYRRRLNLSA